MKFLALAQLFGWKFHLSAADVESREPTDDEKARTAVRSRAFFLIAFGEKQFMRLDMTDEERKAARDLVEELRRKRKK